MAALGFVINMFQHASGRFIFRLVLILP